MIKNFSGLHKFLSNDYRVDVLYEEIVFKSVSHAYHAAKFDRADHRYRIADCLHPRLCWPLAKELRKYQRKDWDKKREEIMQYLLRVKFAVGSPLAAKLLATGSQELVFLNPIDSYWGVVPYGDGTVDGSNLLGKQLMLLRLSLEVAVVKL